MAGNFCANNTKKSTILTSSQQGIQIQIKQLLLSLLVWKNKITNNM